MLSYEIKIYERNAITDVKVDSLAETLKLDESLDSGVMTIPRATRNTAFKRFSKVKVKITDNATTPYSIERYYLIYTTKVQIDSKGGYKTYTHTIGLIEPTKWLEKFQVGSLSFRQPINGTPKTVYDYLERLLKLTPFVPYERVPNTRIVKVDSTFTSILTEKVAPQLTFEKKNLREALIEIFKTVNAIPRMYYDSGQWYITGDFINQRKLLFEIDGDITDYMEEASGENFAQSAEIFHENTIPDDNAGIIYAGSITDYIYYRSNDVIVGESNLKLVLSQKMAELKKIYIVLEVYDDELKTNIEKIFDITNFCVERNVYNSLDFDGGLGTQALSFYWSYRSNEIDGLNETFNAIFEKMAIENIIEEIGSSDDYKDVIFRVEYVPYFETMRSIQYREDKDPYIIEDDLFDQYSGIQINQQERLNYLYDLTDNVYGQIQRLGVETVSISKKHYILSPYNPDTNPNGIYQVGDYTSDGYFVTKVELVYGRTFVIGRYELSKNWNRIAQFIQIDQEFRPYEISLTKNDATIKRDILFNIGFVEVSLEERNDLVGRGFLETTFMNTFLMDKPVRNITLLALQSSEFRDNVILPCGSLAEKNGLKWKADLFDTKLAGKRITGQRDTLPFGGLISRIVQTQEGVYYTRSNGELDFIRVGLANSLGMNSIVDDGNRNTRDREGLREDAKSFPRYSGSLTSLIYNIPTYEILKDRGEILGFEINLPIVVDSRNFNTFVIGDSLIKDNKLIREDDVGNKRFVGLTERIEKTNTQKIDISGKTFQAITDFDIIDNAISVPSVITDFDYYAITDSEGNLYLGVNQLGLDGVKTTVSAIYFNFVNQRYKPPVTVIDNEIGFGEFTILLDFNAEVTVQYFYNETGNLDLDLDVSATVSKIEFINYSVNVAFDLDLLTTATISQNEYEEVDVSTDFGIDLDVIPVVSKMEYEAQAVNTTFDLSFDILPIVSKGTKIWVYISSQSTEPTNPSYINGGTDVSVSDIVNPSESPYNYNVDDIVYYDDGDILDPTWYIYKVENKLE